MLGVLGGFVGLVSVDAPRRRRAVVMHRRERQVLGLDSGFLGDALGKLLPDRRWHSNQFPGENGGLPRSIAEDDGARVDMVVNSLKPSLRSAYPLIGSAASAAGVISILAAPAWSVPVSAASAGRTKAPSRRTARNNEIIYCSSWAGSGWGRACSVRCPSGVARC